MLTFSNWRDEVAPHASKDVIFSAKIYYSLALNRHGRQHLFNKMDSNTKYLINLLVIADEDTKQRIRNEKALLVEEFYDTRFHSLKFSTFFDMLRADPNLWCHDSVGTTNLLDTVSTNYRLLREIPGLWCHPERPRGLKRTHQTIS